MVKSDIKKEYKQGHKLWLNPTLKKRLGFDDSTESLTGPGKIVGSSQLNLHIDFYGIYVYCNIVEERLVGDTCVPLLRVVPAYQQQQNSVVCHLYEKPHYIPVSRRQFQSIEIILNTDTGEEISFEGGKTVITLHFRRRKFQ